MEVFSKGTERLLVKNSASFVNISLPLRSSSVFGLWKVLCLDTTYIRPFSSSCEERIYTPLSFSTCFLFQLQALIAPELAQQGRSQRIQIFSHSSTFSVYLSRILLFVCHSFHNIRLLTYAIKTLLNPVIFEITFTKLQNSQELQGQMMERVNERM